MSDDIPASDLQIPPPEAPVVVLPEDRREHLPEWVTDPEQSEQTWNAYRLYLEGKRVHEISRSLGISAPTVYRCIERARAELPYVTVRMTHELVERRQDMIMRGMDMMAEVATSDAAPVRKAEAMAKLITALNPYYTATEQLLGYNKEGRVVIQNTGPGATNQVAMMTMDDLKRAKE